MIHIDTTVGLLNTKYKIKTKLKTLQKCAVVATCRVQVDPCRAASRPIPIAKVKTLNRGLGLGFVLWPFHLLTSGLVHADVLPCTIYRLWCW